MQIEDKKKTKNCPVADISAVNVVDRHLCIWRQGQDEVWGRVPEGSANAFILQQLLVKELSKRPVTSLPEGHLGRIIFERSSKKNVKVMIWFAGFTALVGLILWGIVPLEGGGGDPMMPILMGAGCLFLAGIVGLYAMHCRNSTFRCHELGVYQRGLLSKRQLNYSVRPGQWPLWHP